MQEWGLRERQSKRSDPALLLCYRPVCTRPPVGSVRPEVPFLSRAWLVPIPPREASHRNQGVMSVRLATLALWERAILNCALRADTAIRQGKSIANALVLAWPASIAKLGASATHQKRAVRSG